MAGIEGRKGKKVEKRLVKILFICVRCINICIIMYIYLYISKPREFRELALPVITLTISDMYFFIF